MKLISMTDFVLEQTMKQNTTNTFRFCNCEKYANFLKQHLELWMFVPCDEDGNVLEEPKLYKEWLNSRVSTSDFNEIILLQEYQQAKERCLFNGFNETIQQLKNLIKIKITVENIVKYNLQLTKTAEKLIGM